MNVQLFSTKKPILETTRVVLTEPFVRHAAGHVFELSATTGTSGWDDDDRVRERQNFGNKQTYFLPDGGNGAAYDLSVSATKPCPPDVFDHIDLRSGPCRVTGSTYSSHVNGPETLATSLKYQVQLFEINGLNAQGITIPLEQKPSKIVLTDVLRQEILRQVPAEDNLLHLGFADLLPGFYRLEITTSEGSAHFVRVFKAFPLLVLFPDRSGRFSTQKTMY